MLCYCANLKAIRYESTGLNRIITDKSHSVIVAKHVICEINDEFIIDEWAWLTVYKRFYCIAQKRVCQLQLSATHAHFRLLRP